MADYDDIATLGIRADTSSLAQAISKLEELKDSAQKTEAATNSLGNRSAEAGRQLSGMSKTADSLRSSMSGVYGQLIAVVAAYKSFAAINAQMKIGFAYNEQLEKAQLGIAAVIASTMSLADQQGRLLAGQEKFNAAQKMSVDMAKALDVASMQSPAGYVDLLSTFQRLLAPSAQLGLQWQDTLGITIKMSNVLSALGLDMEKLGVETEAILTGRNLSHSQVAMRLGITREELSSWGQGAKLMENFQKRFEAFAYAGVAVESTMEAVRAYYEDVLANIAGDASKGLWTGLKGAMLEVADAFYEIDEASNQFRVREEMQPLVDLVHDLGEGLGEAVVGGVRGVMDAVRGLGSAVGGVDTSRLFDNLVSGAKVAVAALAAVKIARMAAMAEFSVASASGGESRQVTGLASYVRELGSAARATRQKALAEVEAATAARAAAQAELAKFHATQQSALATRNATQAQVIKAALEKQEIALKQQLVVAEQRYFAAVTASGTGMGRVIGLFSALRAAGGGLLALFGGPLGLAFTALAAGVAYLATQESASSRFAREHADALRMVSSNADEARQAIEAYAKKLSEMSAIQLRNEKREVEQAMRAALGHNDLYRKMMNIMGPSFSDMFRADSQQWLDDVRKLLEPLKDGNFLRMDSSAQLEFLRKWKESLAEIADKYGLVGVEKKALEEMQGLEAATVRANELAAALKDAGHSAHGAANGIQAIGAAAQRINGLGDLLASSEIARFASTLSDGDKHISSMLGNVTVGQNKEKLSVEQHRAILRGDWKNQALAGFSEADRKSLQTVVQNYSAAFSNNAGRRSGGGGSSGIDGAVEKLRKFREEMALLNGEASQGSVKIADKFADIEKAGRDARMSAEAIALFKEEYRNAFAADVFRQFDKEMLRLTGNTAALRDMEISEKLSDWQHQFAALGLTAAEAAPKLEAMREALAQEARVKDLQVAAGFYREFASLSADTGQSLEIQNRLIEEQARLWAAAGIPLKDIDLMLKLQKEKIARDPWSGTLRGLRRYANEATDLGKGMEDVWVNGFSAMEDAMTEFVLKGKMDFNSLANSIINDLTRIAIRSMITGPLASGLGSLFSGMFGGTYSAAQTSTMASNGMVWSGGSGSWLNGIHGHAKGGVLSGGNLSLYSNSVVTSPTLFSFDSKIPAFANGVGLMGEAGAEAVMPLRRGPSGRLGVEMFPSLGRHADFTPRQLSHQQITINFIDKDGNKQQQTARSDGMGNMTIDVFINEIDKGLAQRVSQGKSQTARALDASRGLNSARQLYN